MPSRLAVAALAALAPLTLAACEKQNPIITITASGVVVKAKAVRYCRGEDCRVTTENPTLRMRVGDPIGIDVPRSIAEDGWKVVLPDRRSTAVYHDHYRLLGLPVSDEPMTIAIVRDGAEAGEWRFTLVGE